MPVVVVDGIKTFYEQSSAGPDLVVVHGLTYDHTCWSAQVAVLSRSCRVKAYDLPGHGQSSAPTDPFQFDFYIEHLSALMSALGMSALGIPTALLAGHSIGARLFFNTLAPSVLSSKVSLFWTVNCPIHSRESRPRRWKRQ